MQFNQRDSGLVVPVEKEPEPTSEPEVSRGQYGEPWEVGEATTDDGRSYAGILVNGEREAVQCRSAKSFDEFLCGGALADRIVLCVNACRGIADEALSRVVSGEFPLIVDYSHDDDEG